MGTYSAFTFESGGRTFLISSSIAASIRAHIFGTAPEGSRGVLFGEGENPVQVLAVRHGSPVHVGQSRGSELAGLLHLFSEPGELGAGQLQPVGWYVSCRTPDPHLTANDRELHRTLFEPRSLLLLCEQTDDGEIRFSSKDLSKKGILARAAGWTWPVAIAALFALVCLSAALGFHRDSASINREQSSDMRLQCTGEEAHAADLSRQLAFETARNRRLEVMIAVLQEKEGKKTARAGL